MNSLIQQITNNSVESLIGKTYVIPNKELNNTAYNKIKFTDNAIYIYMKTDTTTGSINSYTEMEIIYKATDDNEIKSINNYIVYSDSKDFKGIYFKMSAVGISNLSSKEFISYSSNSMVSSLSPLKYFTSYEVSKKIIDGDVTIHAGYGDDRSQFFDIYTPIGKLEARTNVVHEGEIDENTSIHTDYYNSDKELSNDIELKTSMETIYEYTGYFTWIEEPIYFEGPAINTVESLKETYATLYDKHWINFRNEDADYTQLSMIDSDITIFDSIKE